MITIYLALLLFITSKSDSGNYGDGYDDDCNCNDICPPQPEEWEFDYNEVPPCIKQNCESQLNTCANNDQCVSGIEKIVAQCYQNHENPMQCMDDLIKESQNGGTTQLCENDSTCAGQLQSLGECVINSASYGFCPEEEYKKLELQQLAKTIKLRSRQNKRKLAASRQKSFRKSLRQRSSKRGRRASKLRRKLSEESQGLDYEDDGGCYCNCGEEDDESPDCITANCGSQLTECAGSKLCNKAIQKVVAECYIDEEDQEKVKQCVDEIIKESDGKKAKEFCQGCEECAGNLQALGDCVINSADYGFCTEKEAKKIKGKVLLKTLKKVRARKLTSKQKKSRSERRARSAKLQRDRKLRQRRVRVKNVKPRGRKAARSRVQKGRGRSRRKLQSASDSSCCDCTNTEPDAGCSANPDCEAIVCPLDSYCCNNNWDGICANGANNICLAKDYWSWESTPSSFVEDSYDPDNTGTTGSCCECAEVGDGPGCNAVCDNEVCGLDPYCCNNYWDSICANGASNICQGYEYWNYGGTPYYGSSYNENPAGEVEGSCCDCQDSKPYATPFCNTECDKEICPLDSYCCNTSWDWICANSAKDICTADEANANQEESTAGGDGEGGCCGCTDSKNTPFCNDICDAEICPLDPYCCNNQWDGICANSANTICEGQQQQTDDSGTSSATEAPSDAACCDCTNTESDSGCSANPECEQIVCPLDSWCCNVNWDSICANGANNICSAKDYWSWESTPASFTEDSYDSANTGTTGSCCDCTDTGSGPGCNAVCDNEVCGLDPYCCNNYWDGICANGANNICTGYEYWGGSASYPSSSYEDAPTDAACCDCTNTEPDAGCSANPDCEAIVCPLDSYCCNNNWDGICANGANNICLAKDYWSWETTPASFSEDSYDSYNTGTTGSCCDCTETGSGPGCNAVCDNEVCGLDPYCCNNYWDGICANGANNICSGYEYWGGSASYSSSYEPVYYSSSYAEPAAPSDAACCDCTNTEPDAGCSANPNCEAIVCPLDSYCCNNNWDGICANGANNICLAKDYWSWESTPSSFSEDSYDSYNSGTTGSCCDCTETGSGPGCNAVCDNEVCGLDPYCCNNYWDGICANGANNICTGYEYWGGSSDYGYSSSYYDPYSSSYYSSDYGYSSSYYDPYSSSYYSSSYDPYSSDYGYSSSYYDPYSSSYYSSDYGYSSSYYDPYSSSYYSSDYGYSSSYYGSSDSYYGSEGQDEIPDCVEQACNAQLTECANSGACMQAVKAVIDHCYENNETPQQCMDDLVAETNDETISGFCNGKKKCIAKLKALGTCVINNANYGFCDESYKKLKGKSLLKSLYKIRSKLTKQSRARKGRRSRRMRPRGRSQRKPLRPRGRRAAVRPRSRAQRRTAPRSRVQRQRPRGRRAARPRRRLKASRGRTTARSRAQRQRLSSRSRAQSRARGRRQVRQRPQKRRAAPRSRAARPRPQRRAQLRGRRGARPRPRLRARQRGMRRARR